MLWCSSELKIKSFESMAFKSCFPKKYSSGCRNSTIFSKIWFRKSLHNRFTRKTIWKLYIRESFPLNVCLKLFPCEKRRWKEKLKKNFLISPLSYIKIFKSFVFSHFPGATNFLSHIHFNKTTAEHKSNLRLFESRYQYHNVKATCSLNPNSKLKIKRLKCCP